MPNPLKIATKGAEIGFQVGTFVAGQAINRVKSLVDRDGGGDDDRARYAPTTPPKLESVPRSGSTSTGSKPTTQKSTATGPGGTKRTAPKATPTGTDATRRTAPAAPATKDITAKPSTGDTKGETATTVKATSRTGARSAGGRISNPKAARKVRARAAAAEKKASGATEAKGKGGRPAAVKAENTPAELTDTKQGRQPAPLGSTDSTS